MKVAIIGSRGITVNNIGDHLPEGCDEIVSGGAKGVDTCAEEYANANGIKLTVFLPDYARFGKGAPLKRNEQIAEYADEAIAFWDGKSKGTEHTINMFRKRSKAVKIVEI